MSAVGVETSNLYSAFVWLALRLLVGAGEFVAITPRSFMNGSYFRSFRQTLSQGLALRRVHASDTRDAPFAEDGVLQENAAFHEVWGDGPGAVRITTLLRLVDDGFLMRTVEPADLILPHDPERVLHVVPDETDAWIAANMWRLPHAFAELGISGSPGRPWDYTLIKASARAHRPPHVVSPSTAPSPHESLPTVLAPTQLFCLTTEHHAHARTEPSLDIVGDPHDSAMAKPVIVLCKAEVIGQRDSCQNASTVEFATLKWVGWHNHQCLFGSIGYVPPEGREAQYNREIQDLAIAVLLKTASFRHTMGDSMVANSVLSSSLRRIGNEHLSRRGRRFTLCPTTESHQSRPSFRDIPSSRKKHTHDSQ